jgi:hypothetical protein
LTAPVIDNSGSLFVMGIRLTKLNDDGTWMTGPGAGYATDALATISAGLEYNEGSEVTQNSGTGAVCVYFKAPDTVKRGVISDFTICTPDPVVKQFVIGGDVITTPAVAEVQTVTITGGPTGGTFTLTFAGQTTAGIAYNAAASAVQSALEALSNVEPGDVTVTGSTGGPYTLTWASARGNVAQVTANGAALTGGTSPAVNTATGTPGQANATIGYKAPLVGAVAVPNGVALEFWTRAVQDGGSAAELPYYHWTAPRSDLKLSANLAASAESAMTPTFEGFSNQNPNWGAGPYGDWPATVQADRVWQYVRVASLPDLSPGYINVGA